MTIGKLITMLQSFPPDEEIFGRVIDSDGEPYTLTVMNVKVEGMSVLIELEDEE